ncbi:hypothetical protein NECAME_18382 [Necator americanus]|uniref:Uncharacterized protein n=1 Tax=Necator americanus TaxID=51031 RepID=W2SXP4_NECAM|nr:hypothetical protein NECAME_18382 [Necator americanus]ETN73377.1 hypothetical protein NECAME_18382 [Necator americanus]
MLLAGIQLQNNVMRMSRPAVTDKQIHNYGRFDPIVCIEDAQAQAMVASFCGRSFDDCETDEIAQRIRRATANINVEIETLMEFLTHKGAIS